MIRGATKLKSSSPNAGRTTRNRRGSSDLVLAVQSAEVVDSATVDSRPLSERMSARRAVAREKGKSLLRTWEDGREEADKDQLMAYRLQFEQLITDLDEYDDAIQSGMTGVALQEDVGESEHLRDQLRGVVREIFLIGHQNVAEPAVDVAGQRVSGARRDGREGACRGGRKAGTKLPKLDMQKYNGDPIRWQEFWEQFECSVSTRSDLSDCEKFSYLKALLTDKALSKIEGYSLTSIHYHAAIQDLKEDFGDTQIVIAAIFEAIIQLSIDSTDAAAVRTFFDSMQRLIRSLEAQGLHETEFSKVFVPLILMKLPSELKIALTRKKGGSPWNLGLLRQLLKEEVMTQEACKVWNEGDEEMHIQKFAFWKTTSNTMVSNSRTRGNFISRARHRSPKCGYCGMGHFSDQCQTYPTMESRKRLLGIDRCFNCLGHHLVHQCRRHSCPFCHGRHHRSLCPTQNGETNLTRSD